VAALAHATDPIARPFVEQMRFAARSVGLRVQTVVVRGPEEFDGAFAAMVREQTRAVVVQSILATPRVADLALRHHLPTVASGRRFVEAGGLISFGARYPDLYRRTAYFVDRILRGAKPADLPVEQPTKFELVINLKTAKTFSGSCQAISF
jgi:putative ABC transport system substrate-binding protein